MSKILLTGAFGNVGRHTLDELLQRGHEVTCFDLPTRENRMRARLYTARAHVTFGDITSYADIADCLSPNDAVIHLAAIIPPLSERKPTLAEKVNFQGTRNIVDAILSQEHQIPLVFASSVSVYGRNQDPKTTRTKDDPLESSDHYTSHKIKSEAYIKDKLQKWSILRLGVVPPPPQLKFDPMMYELPVATPIHVLHPRDAALAFTNCIDNPAVQRQTLLIGGDESCRMTYGTYLNRILRALGTALPPDRCFTKESYYSYWMDTRESQDLLHYQQHSFDDFIKDVVVNWGWRRRIIKYFSPFIERWMEQKSPYGKN